MKRHSQFKVKYVYNQPKTPEEKAEQQRKLDKAFDMIFDKILKDELKQNDDTKSKKGFR